MCIVYRFEIEKDEGPATKRLVCLGGGGNGGNRGGEDGGKRGEEGMEGIERGGRLRGRRAVHLSQGTLKVTSSNSVLKF